jgi:hypothetical protein
MIFRAKPQYLLAIPKTKAWETTLIFQRIYKIDYDINLKNLEAYFLLESIVGKASPTENRSIKPVTIVTLYGGWENPSYRWYRPNIDAIIEEGNFALLHNLLVQDVFQYI